MTVVAHRSQRSHVRDVDELDMALLDAMNVNPRASFEQLGSALGVSAVTAPAAPDRREARLGVVGTGATVGAGRGDL